MDNNDLKQFINAIGAMAEIATLYWNKLTYNDIPENVATELTYKLINSLIRNSREEKGDEK